MKLSFSAYCGMSYDIESDNVRQSAARNHRSIFRLLTFPTIITQLNNSLPIFTTTFNKPDTAGILCLDDEDDFEDEDDDDYLEEAEYWQNENEDERDDN